MNRTRASESGLYAAAIEFTTKQRINNATIDAVASFIGNHHVLQHPPSRDCQEAQLADSSVLMLLNLLTAAAVAVRGTTA